MLTPRWLITAVVVVCAIVLICGLRQASRVLSLPKIPLQGAVLVDGQPAHGAEVWLYSRPGGSTGARPLASGVADEKGQVRLHLLGLTPGVPAGDYSVTMSWRPHVIQGEDWVTGPNRIPARFGDPRSTPLKISVFPHQTRELEWRLQGCGCEVD